MNILVELTEAKLDDWKALGYEYVAIFRLMTNHDFQFVEAYKSFEELSAAKKYWMANDYSTYKLWDLDYLDYIRERESSV